jgi:long-chain acyl-CoA synthetase
LITFDGRGFCSVVGSVDGLSQVWVYGNSFESTLVAVVVPKADAIKDWAKANGKTGAAS